MDSLFTYKKAPFLRSSAATWRIMLCVILALSPAVTAGCISYGISAVMILVTSVCSAFAAELLMCLIFRRVTAAGDLSAVVTGLIFGLLMPPDLPLWQAAAGSAASIIIIKQLCGGIGKNPINPAAAGRLAMLYIFKQTMSTYRIPMTMDITEEIPALTGSGTYWDLFLGNTAGTIGETCAAAALIGGIFLILTGIISPAAPFGYLAALALCSFAAGRDVIFELLAGGVLFGAFFMATDYTTTPMTRSGKLLFGIGCGAITFCIRQFTHLPESVSTAILLMNLLTPLLNRITRPRPFGGASPKPAE